MKINDLYPGVLTLLLIAVLVGVGLTVLSNLSTSIDIDTDVVNETVTIAASAGQLTATSNVDDITRVQNVTTVIIDDNISTSNAVNFTAAGVITVGEHVSDGGYNFTYNYDASSTASTAVDNSVTAVDDFVTWFGVIVVILAAGVIIGLVMSSFVGGRG